jgi:hypothetical protein
MHMETQKLTAQYLETLEAIDEVHATRQWHEYHRLGALAEDLNARIYEAGTAPEGFGPVFKNVRMGKYDVPVQSNDWYHLVVDCGVLCFYAGNLPTLPIKWAGWLRDEDEDAHFFVIDADDRAYRGEHDEDVLMRQCGVLDAVRAFDAVGERDTANKILRAVGRPELMPEWMYHAIEAGWGPKEDAQDTDFEYTKL